MHNPMLIYKSLLRPWQLQHTYLVDMYFSFEQPGPRDSPMHCFIRRNKKKSTFYLYLSLTQG
jgi:hypothetical protein